MADNPNFNHWKSALFSCIALGILGLVISICTAAGFPGRNAEAPEGVQISSGQSATRQKPDDMANMPGMKMDDMNRDVLQHPDGAKSATSAMSDHHMKMDGHMFMTDLRTENVDDDRRAEEILAELRPAIAKYRDVRLAEADGYRIFAPNVPQPEYHFTNYRYSFKAIFMFDPAHPTSLLYEKTADGYELVGVMYTARKRASLDELNKRVPLSVARWHKHVDFCLPPRGTATQDVDWKKFGMGSIVTKDACDANGGRWYPQVLGWMVHVYPFEKDPQNIWSR
jgi:hypothetical protein